MTTSNTVKVQTFEEQHTALQTSIRRWRIRSHQGLWAIAVFSAVSIPAMLSDRVFPPLSPAIKKMLGTPPSSNMISALLVVYAFSAILLVLGRITNGSSKMASFSHIGYLLCFYAFYYFSGVLPENFWAVLATGITILSLESYHIWSHCMAKIKEDEEALTILERRIELKR